MNRSLLMILGACGLVVTAAWYFVRPPGSADSIATAAAKTAANPAANARSDMTLPQLAQKVLGPTPLIGPRTIVPLKSALALEFEKAIQLKPFYDRYIANPEGADAETKYFAAVAIETCIGRARGSQGVTDADRERFQNRLKPNDPNNTQRVEAFNRVVAQCEGFAGTNITAAEAARLYAEAAAAGNPGAKIAVAANQFNEQARAATARGVEARRLTEDQLALVRDGLSSGDPFAIQRAGQLLTWNSTQLVDRNLGAAGDPFNPRDWGAAWSLASCDRGANCGADALRVLNGCAYQGACGYQTLEAYMQFNELAPNVYLAAQQNRATILDAIAQGRWDWLGIAAGSGRVVTTTTPATGTTTPTGTRGNPTGPPGTRRPGG
ncbi:MAG: hypothetical protein LH481_17520 [Burkholderiales bacterium]|nr:hypothetical protein [Burkholderiales bacterium]